MNQQVIPLILVVENHWLVGKMRTLDQRVLDLLNDPQTDYLNLEGVKVYSSFDRKCCLATLDTMVIPKERLYLAIVPTDRFEIPRKKRLHKIVEKRKVDVVTVDAGYLVRGKIHLTTHVVDDARYILSNVLGHFFPITGATVSGPGTEPVTASAVLANKDYVSSISCGHFEPEQAARPTGEFAAAGAGLADSVTAHVLAGSF